MTKPLLQIKNLDTQFGGKVIHKNISLDVFQGEFVLLMGGSGSGKSTFIDFIMEDLTTSTGDLIWKGEAWDKSDICYKIGFAPQSGGFLSDMTVGENIALPLEYVLNLDKQASLDIAFLNMQMIGLDPEVFNKYPEMLSGGMARRVAIARAIILGQPLIILDEPLSGLDPISCKSLIKIIKSLTPHRTILCVSHNFILADRYVIFHDSSIISGTLEEVVQDPFGREFIESFKFNG